MKCRSPFTIMATRALIWTFLAVAVAASAAAAAGGGTTPAAGSMPSAGAPAAAGAAVDLGNDTCLACHTSGRRRAPKVNAEALARSVHHALNCVDCHASISQLPHAAAVAPVDCASCHAAAHRSYMQTAHGQAAALGLAAAPGCADCHDTHGIRAPSAPQSTVSSAHLAATCGACHAGANAKFTEFDPHPQPSDPGHSTLVYWTHIAMVVLLAGVFGFFGLHTALWLQRSVIARLRGELPVAAPVDAGAPYIKRFSPVERTLHVIVIVSFMLLAMTGLPLMYPTSVWAPHLIRLFGGVRMAHRIHLANAAITFGYFLFHLLYLAYRVVVKKARYKLFGTESMVPTGRDILDILRNFRWFLYAGPRPRLDRWTYWEKFDYWAVFWGVAIIGLSGLMLAFPLLSTRVAPGSALNVAFVLHGEEAILATGFIFIFHFFHNHLRPENFPIDVTIFTGRLPLARFKEERPLQYDRLVAEGRLEQALAPPPSRFAVVISMVFGFAVVVTGIVLILLVITAPPG